MISCERIESRRRWFRRGCHCIGASVVSLTLAAGAARAVVLSDLTYKSGCESAPVAGEQKIGLFSAELPGFSATTSSASLEPILNSAPGSFANLLRETTNAEFAMGPMATQVDEFGSRAEGPYFFADTGFGTSGVLTYYCPETAQGQVGRCDAERIAADFIYATIFGDGPTELPVSFDISTYLDHVILVVKGASSFVVDGQDLGPVVTSPGPELMAKRLYETLRTDQSAGLSNAGRVLFLYSSAQNACYAWTIVTEDYFVAHTDEVLREALHATYPLPDVPTYLRYDAKASKVDNNRFPKDFNLSVDDASLANSEPDDPENYAVEKERSVLLPALAGGGAAVDPWALSYVRYQTKEAKQGIGAAVAGKFPKAVKAPPRRWELTNSLGTITVDTKKATALLIPASVNPTVSATPLVGEYTPYACYQAKIAKGVASDQAPEGKKLAPLQTFLVDKFHDCALDADGNVTFASTSVEGTCLFDLTKPVELCSPATTSPVTDGRETVATIAGETATTSEVLLCYKPKLAKSITSESAATLAEATVGDSIAKQSKTTKRRLKDANPVYVAPSDSFPAPTELDTSKVGAVCLPTVVNSVGDL